jgi:hypothetical protein
MRADYIRIYTRFYGDPELLRKCIEHDYLLYGPNEKVPRKKALMKEPSLYEWIRFLINLRITQIKHGINPPA